MNRWQQYQAHKDEIDAILARSSKPNPTITLAEVELLLGNNYSAVIRPRKKLVVVGGYNHYRLVE